jgi:choice-of-anchor A domain-containing protein
LLAFVATACGAPELSGQETSGDSTRQALSGDTTPPVSEAATIPDPDQNGEYHGDVTVWIQATDNASGVEGIYYSFSGATTGGGVIEGNEAWLPVINNLGTTTVTYYAKDVAGNYEAPRTLTILITELVTCSTVSLRDFTLYLKGSYTGGHDVRGKVAVGGNLTMEHFSIGAGLPADDLSNVLVAGGALNITHGGVFGNAHYGTSTTANGTVTFYRGALSQGSNVDFGLRNYELETLSEALFSLTPNGTVKRETWGGLYLKGTHAKQNVFTVNASVFTNLRYFSINVPSGSQTIINVKGDSVAITGFGNGYTGATAANVLFNFEATNFYARSYGFFGTILAPNAHVDFSNGSWDGGLYAASMAGNAEGHLAPLRDFEICVKGGGI